MKRLILVLSISLFAQNIGCNGSRGSNDENVNFLDNGGLVPSGKIVRFGEPN